MESTPGRDKPGTLQAVRIPIVADKSDYAICISLIIRSVNQTFSCWKAATIAALGYQTWQFRD